MKQEQKQKRTRQHDTAIMVRVNARERRAFKVLAAQRGMTMSDIVREVIQQQVQQQERAQQQV
jgi:predicted DNA binding CopG/RHH family protein